MQRTVTGLRRVLRSHANGVAADWQDGRTGLAYNQRRRQKVHAGAADEAGDKGVAGPVVKLKRRANLLHPASAQHHNFVRQRHGLDLVVRDVHHGGPQPGM